MGTTTLRLPDELKIRIEALAADAGDSTHAFMVKALDEATGRMEREREFHAEALRRLEHMERTGEYIELDDLRRYALALAAGEKDPPRPPLRIRPVVAERAPRTKRQAK